MALLELRDVSHHFTVKTGLLSRWLKGKSHYLIKAVETINFALEEDEVLGIAGESGCGKSTTCMMIAGILAPTSGAIYFDGKRADQMTRKELKWYRKQVQMIFQDPYESLNPRFTVFDTVAEGPRSLGIWKEPEIADRTMDMLKSVGLPPEKYMDRYPHELSGGERQRVGIASALVMEPRMVIADEPLSMLDVSIRAGILDLLKDLAKQRHFSCIYVSHDLSILGNIANRLMVMYLGQAMEIGPTAEVIKNPQHPYTRALINAVPVPDPKIKRPIPNIKGDISKPINPLPGCRFINQCPYSDDSCRDTFIKLQLDEKSKFLNHQHQVACHRLDFINKHN